MVDHEIFAVYVLYSLKSNIFYTGFTGNLIKRYHDHNYLNLSGFTTKHRPWIVLYTEIYLTKSEALKREKFLKSGKCRELIKQNIAPEYLAHF
ncbi:MAG: GIY-YIG nuclease family protein [Saprospiraceae bacterium]|nr:GIY-YIG nuclease family protein [Saprospiraceae bacterium]